MLSQDICPSDTRRYLSKRLNIWSNFFVVELPHNSIFFRTRTYDNIPKGLLAGKSNAGVWKNIDFRPVFRIISEMIQDRATISMQCE